MCVLCGETPRWVIALMRCKALASLSQRHNSYMHKETMATDIRSLKSKTHEILVLQFNAFTEHKSLTEMNIFRPISAKYMEIKKAGIAQSDKVITLTWHSRRRRRVKFAQLSRNNSYYHL
jgi:hypothetical protein